LPALPNPYTIIWKKIFQNDYIWYMSKRDEIAQRIREVASSKYPDAEVYLYGSQARNVAKAMSDVEQTLK